uniref:Uncharacterized protein n=1 Tax=Vitis vinifera TaxID=29760 RepID=F6I2Q7_VITVI
MEKPSFGHSDVAEALTKINSTSHRQQMELLKTVVMNHTHISLDLANRDLFRA